MLQSNLVYHYNFLKIFAGHIVAVFIVFVSSSPSLSFQQDEKQDKTNAEKELHRVEQELKQRQDKEKLLRESAEQAQEEVQNLKKKLVQAAHETQAIEAQATKLEDNIAHLQLLETQKSQSLGKRRREMAFLLASLERLSQRPPALSLIKPGEAIDTARSARLLGGIVPQIEEKAKVLKNELTSLLEVKKELTGDKNKLIQTLDALKKQRHKLEELKTARDEASKFALQEAGKEAQAASRLARQADNLKDLISKLERAANAKRLKSNRSSAPVSTGFGLAKGMLTMPAKGTIIEYFGAPMHVGKSKGIRMKTRPAAQVIAPFDGEIVFSGPFRNYGQILIISHGDGYHSLLAGMQSIYGNVGEWVLAGEPVGIMHQNIATKGTAELYIELRHNNKAFNPVPWLEKK